MTLKIRYIVIAFAILFLLKMNMAIAGSATFIQDGGIWSDPNSWSPTTVPNSSSDVATFSDVVGTFASLNVDGNFSVASLDFTTAYNIFLNSGTLNIYESISVDAATAGANCNTTLSLQNDISIVTDAQLSTNSIVGTGAIIKTGASALRVSDTSTYSGTTFINEGIFQAGADNAFSPHSAIVLANVAGVELNNQGIPNTILSLSGGGNLGGDVTFDNVTTGSLTLGDSTNTTFAGVISGLGALIKQGSGTFTLTGTNTYTEGTTLSEGAISLGADAALGSGALSMANGTTLYINSGVSASNPITLGGTNTLEVSAGSGTLSGVISGASGVLVKTGSGMLILSNTNTYGGGTLLNAGTLSIDSADSIGGSTQGLTLAGGTLSSTGVVTLSGAILVTANSEITTAAGQSTALTGTLSGSDQATLSVSGDGVNSISTVSVDSGLFTLAGELGGSEPLTKIGAGTLRFSGESPSLTGELTVEAGELNLDGTLGAAVTIHSGATLSGTGSVGSITNSGILAPGNSIGTISTGTLILTSESTYQVEVDPSQSTLLEVTETATLGGTLEITQSAGSYPLSGQFTIIQAPGGISGSFSSVIYNPLPGFEFTIEVLSDKVLISYTDTQASLKGSSCSLQPQGSSLPFLGCYWVFWMGIFFALRYRNRGGKD